MSVEDAPTIGLASCDLESSVVHTIRVWATAFPGELVAFDKQMKAMRRELLKEKGMSSEGHMALYGETPVRLYRLMQFHYGQHWDRDQTLLKYFWRNFTVGKINKHAKEHKAVDQSCG